MLLALVRRFFGRPDAQVKTELNRREWCRLQLILRTEDQDGLTLWLKQTARQGYQLQDNFDQAARGLKSRYCMAETVALERKFMARQFAYARAISGGWIDGPKIPRLYSAPMDSFIRYHCPEVDHA